MRVIRAAITATYRLRGAAVGARAHISPRAVVRQPRNITIGERTIVGRNVEINPQGGTIQIGADCSLQNGCVLYGAGSIRIGDGSRIANGVTIVSFNHVTDDPIRPIREQGITAMGISLDGDNWIGTRAVILDGVRIGRGAVVAAGAVVTHDVEPGSIVGGVPAKPIAVRGRNHR